MIRESEPVYLFDNLQLFSEIRAGDQRSATIATNINTLTKNVLSPNEGAVHNSCVIPALLLDNVRVYAPNSIASKYATHCCSN
jgi:hypothetical protein